MKLNHNPPKKYDGERNRVVWPFKDMRVNDVVEVDDQGLWNTAVKRAHSYAVHQTPEWRMACQWLADKGFGVIRRME